MRCFMYKINKLCFFLLLSFFLTIFDCNFVQAEEDRIKVGFYDYPHFQEINNDGSYSGYSYDYLQAISQYNGWKYDFITGYTSSECLQLLKEGKIDLMGTVLKTEERLEIYDFADYSSSVTTSLLVTTATNTNFAYEDFTSFNGMNVGLQKDFSRNKGFLDYANDNNFAVNSQIFDTKEQLNKAFEENKIDAALISSSQNDPKYRVIAKFDPQKTYYVTTKGNSAVLNKLNEALHKIEENYPTLQTELYEKYYNFSSGQIPVFSLQELEYIKNNPSLRVLYDDEWGPYEINKKGVAHGISIDVMQKIASISGLNFQFIPTLSEAIKINKMNNFEADIVSAISYDYSWANIHNVYISKPYLSVDYVTLYKNENKHDPNYALVKDYYISRLIVEELPKDANITYYNNILDCIEAVNKGSVDYTFLSSYEAEYYQNITNTPKLKTMSLQLPNLELSIGVSKDQDRILFSIIEKSLCWLTNLQVKEIINNHINHSETITFLSLLYSNPIEFITIVGVILLAFVIACASLLISNYIRQKNAILERVNSAKTTFFSRISHDMRTPLNAILGVAHLAKDKNDVDLIKDDIDLIETSGQMLLGLINDTLDFNKIDSGKLVLNETDIDEEKMIKDVISVIKPLTTCKQIEFIYNHNPHEYGFFIGDENRIKQILINVLTNAIKFTSANGKIVFDVNKMIEDQQQITMKIVISDTGVGMSNEFQKNLFKPFVQENKVNTDHLVGTGLGLSIVKSLIDLMNGSINIKSEENVGTSVEMNFTFKKASNKMKKEGPLDFSILKDKNILICEDNNLNVLITKNLLTKYGVIVEVASNGKTAVEMVQNNNSYDLILMDIRMPEMDGFTATRYIRALANDICKNIPIIALSASAFTETINESSDAGMNDFIIKPIEPKVFYEKIIKLLEKGEKNEIS